MNNELFEKTSIPKAYCKLAIPVVISMVISLVYNMVDTFFIAQTQNTALVAGVSLCAPLFTLMIALGDIFGLGGSSVISRLFGEREDETAKNVSGFCLYAAIVCGVLVSIIMLLFRTPLLSLLGAKGATLTYASQYYFYIALGAPTIIVSMVPNNLLRTEGLAMAAMVGSVIGTIINIVLDPIFIFVLGMGAGGAALATILANLIADAVLLYLVRKKSKKLTVSIRCTKVSKVTLAAIFAIGIPASVTNLMQSVGMTVMNRYLNQYGADKVASMGIAMKINMIVMLVLVGFAFGGQPLVGYNYGAKNGRRTKQVIHFSLTFLLILGGIMAVVMIVVAPHIVRIFMQDSNIVSTGTLMLRALLSTTCFASIALVFTTVFQSTGKSISALILSISRQGILFIACIIVLSGLFGYLGIIWAQAVADVLTAAIALILYSRLRKEMNQFS